jgi:large subunit ribosomal protein L11
MIKKLKTIIKLKLIAGRATPVPPVGPILGQYGINILNFCKEYNEKTLNFNGLIIPVKIFVYEDRSFNLILKTTPTSLLFNKYLNIKKGSSNPNKNIIGSILFEQLKEIAQIKMKDLNTNNLEKAISIISGTAKNMGIDIIK